MKLHRLDFAGIGPFAAAQSIDFDAFTSSDLFLLEGPTGSGKSTIVDALVFALYGAPAGSETSDDRLRSDYLGDRGESYAELTFTSKGTHYRVRRTPKFTRTGRATPVQPTAHLSELARVTDPTGRVLASRVTDVGAEINRILGLNRKQFTQTMVLPQGEFARFLRTDPTTRQELLQQIFGTELFEQVERYFERARREAMQQRAAADDAVRTAIGKFAGAANLGEEVLAQLIDLRNDSGLLRERAKEMTDALRAAAHAASEVAEELQTTLTNASQAFERAERAESIRLELVTLLATQDSLRGKAADVAALRAELDRAERASLVAPTLSAWVQGRESLAEANAALAEALAQLPAEAAALTPDERIERERALRDLVVSLEVALNLEMRTTERSAALANARAAVTNLEAEHERARASLDALPGQRTTTEELLVEQQRLAHDVPLLEQQQQALRLRLAAAAELAELAVPATKAQDRVRALLATIDSTHSELVGLQSRWRAGVAADLATGLSPQTPCPVCGSIEHPQPAQPRADHVSGAALDAAQARERSVRDEFESANAALAAIQSQELLLRDRLGESSDDLPALTQAVEERLVAAQAAVREADRLTIHLKELAAQKEALDAEVLQLATRLSAARTTFDTLAEQATADEATIAHARGEHESVAARQPQAQAVAADLAAATKAHGQVKEAESRERTQAEAFVAAAALHGFEAESDVLASQRDDAVRTDWRDVVAAHDSAEQALRANLNQERFTGVDPVVAIDLEPLREAWQVAQAAHQTGVAAAATANALRDNATSAYQGLVHAMTHDDEVGAESRPLIHLADMVTASTRSNNPHQMPLVAFVLLEKFKDVVAAANDRLVTLSDGRFKLEHTEERTGRERTGLGLSVFDFETGRVREPSSLSGGETFYASLALALGLSDTVVAHAGGVELGTLFVDEGFGSLDPDRLEEVMNVLRHLKQGGRTIGVISHVAEMKEAIPARIEVRRNAEGGSTLSVRP